MCRPTEYYGPAPAARFDEFRWLLVADLCLSPYYMTFSVMASSVDVILNVYGTFPPGVVSLLDTRKDLTTWEASASFDKNKVWYVGHFSVSFSTRPVGTVQPIGFDVEPMFDRVLDLVWDPEKHGKPRPSLILFG